MKTAFITAIIAIAALACLGLTSCTGGYVDANVGYYKPTTVTDPEGKFGTFLSKGKKIDDLIDPQK